MRTIGLTVSLGIALACMAPSWAADPQRVPKLTDASFIEIDGQLKSAKGHPNEEWRLQGLKRYVNGEYARAAEYFERGAGFADKYSQLYLSLMYWHGIGVQADPVRAYVWADLAAERGNRSLLLMREKMWSELTEQQRRDAVASGGAYYDRYGDEAAKPRAETEIRRFARNMTGSRVGLNTSQIEIEMGGPIHGSFGNDTPGMRAASAIANGSSSEQLFYADNRTRIDQYWQAQDALLEGGKVEVGPLTPVRDRDKDGRSGGPHG
jgi:hypothetical protein